MITFKFYSKWEDKTLHLQLSDKVISYVAKQGFTILEKIGEGGSSIACKCRMNDGTFVALLFPIGVHIKKKYINSHDGLAYARELQKNNPESLKYMVKIISTIICPFPYSDDIRYMDHIWAATHYRSNRIEVLELADMTLAERMHNLVDAAFEEKIIFVKNIFNQLLEINEYLDQKGLYYSDLMKENVVFIKDRLVLIDLQSMIEYKSPNESVKDRVTIMINCQILVPYNPLFRECIDNKMYSKTGGIASSMDESEQLKKEIMSSLINS